MPITSSDIALLTSNVAGSAGGAMSGSSITSGQMNNVWPDITDAERVAGGTRYRKVFWRNISGLEAALKPVLYSPVLPVGCTLGLGLGIDNSADASGAQGNMNALSAAAALGLISTGADTRSVTVYGLDNSGTPVPVVSTTALNGTTEVLTAGIFSAVFAIFLSAVDATKTVTARQGAGGTAIGTVGPNQIASWRWLTGANAKAAGIRLPDLPAGGNYGLWMRLAWSAGAAAVRPNTMSVTFEEDA